MPQVYPPRVQIQSRGRPLVVGHRGAPAVAPPNTLEGLEAAVAAGADLVEFDVGAGLLLGHPGEPPPDPPLPLERALAALAPHAIGLHVDLKEPGLELAVAAALRRAGLAPRALVSATWTSSLRALEREAPELTRVVGYPRDRLGAGEIPWPEAVKAGASALARSAMPLRAPLLLARARARALSLHHRLVSRRVVDAVHARGAAVMGWTVNDAAGVERLRRLGVDAVITDDPGMARDVLATLKPE
jgi:glycerophosphoryl diester phosphodiesterase